MIISTQQLTLNNGYFWIIFNCDQFHTGDICHPCKWLTNPFELDDKLDSLHIETEKKRDQKNLDNFAN